MLIERKEIRKGFKKNRGWEVKKKFPTLFVSSQHFCPFTIKTNQASPGDHVCNCGYMVSSAARGKGLATTMCEHSQEIAIELGCKAMQFNLVASTNECAVRLWNKLGFATVGLYRKRLIIPAKDLLMH